jgi:isoleucyl-tRNA synthetase
LYCEKIDSKERKEVITTLVYIMSGLIKVIKPVLPFLAEEVHQNISDNLKILKSENSVFLEKHIFYNNFSNKITGQIKSVDEAISLKEKVFKLFEEEKGNSDFNSISQCKIIFPKKDFEHGKILEIFKKLSMVSDLEVSSICESIEFKKTDLSKCLRC